MIKNESQLIKYLEKEFPKNSAEPWDFVGYNLKKTNQKDLKILTCLDVNNEVIELAIKESVSLIITFHPFKFANTWAEIYQQDPHKKDLVDKLKKHQINVYAIHTNFDKHPEGTKTWLIKKLQWETKILKTFDFAYTLKYKNYFFNLVNELKTKLKINSVWTNINQDFLIDNLYLAPGASDPFEFIQNCESNTVLITSDLKWNEQQRLNDLNYKFIMITHQIENVFVQGINNFLTKVLDPTITIINYDLIDFIKGY